MHHVMLDLETMGNGPRAAIVSIGAVFFNPLTGELGAEFEAHIDLRDSARFGEIDPDTVLWWLQQSVESKGVIAQATGSLETAVNWFNSWVDCNMQGLARHALCVWGNGSGFDNVIFRSAYDALREQNRIGRCPIQWQFWQDRDVRTIVELGRTLCGFDPKKDLPFEGVAHTALADAKHQARYVSTIYQRLAAACKGGEA